MERYASLLVREALDAAALRLASDSQLERAGLPLGARLKLMNALRGVNGVNRVNSVNGMNGTAYAVVRQATPQRRRAQIGGAAYATLDV